MRVVIIGASGNLGSAAVRELSDRGHDVVGVARRRPESHGAESAGSVRWVAADVATDDLGDVLAGADAVVLLAWKFQPTHRPEETWATNAVGSRRVLEAVRRQGVGALVYVSSIAAYSPAPHGRVVDESWATDGTSAAMYCREKAYVERALDAFEASDGATRVVRFRPAFVFQRSAASEQRRIFGGALARPGMFRPGRIPMLPVPRGLQLQAVHAGDVARALAAAVEQPVTGAFNLAAEGLLRRQELGELLETRTMEVPQSLVAPALQTAWAARVAPVPGTLATAAMRLPLLDVTRAREELGWEPRHTALEAVSQAVQGMAERAGSEMPPLRP